MRLRDLNQLTLARSEKYTSELKTLAACPTCFEDSLDRNQLVVTDGTSTCRKLLAFIDDASRSGF